MANTFTPTDVHVLVNAMQQQMFGSVSLAVVDTTTFASVGEKMLRAGVTNTLDALGHVLADTKFGVRQYRGRFRMFFESRVEYGGIERKISFYAKPLTATKAFNTDLNPNTLKDGQSVDQYVINKKYPLEMSFIGMKTESYDDPTWLVQLRQAFTDERSFAAFVSAKLVDIANDLETRIEANNRLLLLNAMGATYNTGNTRQKVNLVTEYNAFYGTSKTASDLLGADYDSFIKFFMMKIKGDMELMRERNELFHIYPARNDDGGNALVLPRHTPPEARRLILYMPAIRQAETTVFPSLFETSYLKLENFEGCEYWQNPDSPASINVKPNQLNVITGASEDGTTVALDHVMAFLYDRDAIEVSLKLDSVLTSPVNAKGKYYVTCWDWAYNFKCDQTENMILYYVA